jgi:RNA polymerase sigma factor (sigma-70 family)
MRHRTPSDAELFEQSRQGKVDAFAALVGRHQGLVCAVSYGTTGDRSLSEDIAQETFLAAWRSLGEIREPSKFRAWLLSTARNLSRKALRHLGRETPCDLANEKDAAPNPLEAAIDRESEQMVWDALKRVPEQYRAPLILFYREGRSVPQVAEAMGLSESAVHQRLSRGRSYLKESVTDLVERTLAGTKPSKAMAASVAAVITAGSVGVAKAAPLTTAATVGGASMKIIKGLVAASLLAGGIAAVSVASRKEPQTNHPKHETTRLGPNRPRAARMAPSLARSPKRLTPARRVQLLRAIQKQIEQAKASRRSAGVASASPPSTLARASSPSRTGPTGEGMGTLDKDYLRERIKEIVPLVRECYELALAQDPSVSGKLSVHFSIIGDPELGGLVESSEIVDDDEPAPKNEGLVECVRETMYALEVEAPKGGGRVTVTYPFRFATAARRQ